MGRERMAKGLCNLTLYEHNCLGHFPRVKLGTFRWSLHRARELLLGRGRHNCSGESLLICLEKRFWWWLERAWFWGSDTHTHSPNRLLMVVVIIKGPCEIVHGSSLFSNKSLWLKDLGQSWTVCDLATLSQGFCSTYDMMSHAFFHI